MHIGIDPGITGAIALLGNDNQFIQVIDMPIMSLSKGKNQINAAHLCSIFNGWDKIYAEQNRMRGSYFTVYLEQVSAMPGQGVSSMFNFGVSYGVIKGVIAALEMPMILVHPSQWKKRAGLIGKDKDYARTLAQQLYPIAELGLKKYIGRADAILIARYGESK